MEGEAGREVVVTLIQYWTAGINQTGELIIPSQAEGKGGERGGEVTNACFSLLFLNLNVIRIQCTIFGHFKTGC